MEKTSPELTPQNNQPQPNTSENQFQSNQISQENNNIPQNPSPNPKIAPSEINNNEMPPSNINSQIPNLLQNMQN